MCLTKSKSVLLTSWTARPSTTSPRVLQNWSKLKWVGTQLCYYTWKTGRAATGLISSFTFLSGGSPDDRSSFKMIVPFCVPFSNFPSLMTGLKLHYFFFQLKLLFWLYYVLWMVLGNLILKTLNGFRLNIWRYLDGRRALRIVEASTNFLKKPRTLFSKYKSSLTLKVSHIFVLIIQYAHLLEIKGKLWV